MTAAVMIDIEGMGKTANAPITSIGAVKFDPDSDWIGEEFHIHVSLENCLRYGMQPDASTIIWWMEQSEAARLALTCGQLEAAPLIDALSLLGEFIPNEAEVWGKGINYDLAALSLAYHRTGLPDPWQYWKLRDMRLLRRLHPEIKATPNPLAHHALHDARNQAVYVQALMAEQRATRRENHE